MKGDEGERKSKEREISFPGKKDAIFATAALRPVKSNFPLIFMLTYISYFRSSCKTILSFCFLRNKGGPLDVKNTQFLRK